MYFFFHLWGKEKGGGVCLYFCFAYGPPVAGRPSLVFLAKVAEFGGRHWKLYLLRENERKRKTDHTTFRAEPFFLHTHWAMIKQKGVVLNCRRSPIHSTNNNTSPHLASSCFPFFLFFVSLRNIFVGGGVVGGWVRWTC